MSLLIAAQIRDCSDQKHAITNREFVIHDYKSTRDCLPHIKNPAFVIRYIHVVKKVKSRPKNHPGNHPEWLPLKSHLSKDPRSCSRSRLLLRGGCSLEATLGGCWGGSDEQPPRINHESTGPSIQPNTPQMLSMQS